MGQFIMNYKYKFVLFLIIIFVIIYIMGLFTWSSLPKDQTDNQTISEAITEAIIAHEEDPTAHLGAGESLEQHKSNDVIDHLAGSIVPDKFSNAQSFLYSTVIPEISGNEDNCSIENWSPFIGLYQASPTSGEGSYFLSTFVPADLGYNNGDVILDIMVSQFGSSGTRLSYVNFGFGRIEVKDNYYRVAYWTTSWQYSSWISVDETKFLRFRFLYDSTNNMLYVYLRDTEVFSVSYTLAWKDSEMDFRFFVNRGTSSAMTALFGGIKYWFDGM